MKPNHLIKAFLPVWYWRCLFTFNACHPVNVNCHLPWWTCFTCYLAVTSSFICRQNINYLLIIAFCLLAYSTCNECSGDGSCCRCLLEEIENEADLSFTAYIMLQCSKINGNVCVCVFCVCFYFVCFCLNVYDICSLFWEKLNSSLHMHNT